MWIYCTLRVYVITEYMFMLLHGVHLLLYGTRLWYYMVYVYISITTGCFSGTVVMVPTDISHQQSFLPICEQSSCFSIYNIFLGPTCISHLT